MSGACTGNRYLKKERRGPLLVKTRIDLKSDKKLSFSERDALLTELTPLVRQQPNRTRFFGLMRPGVWYYYTYRDKKTKYADFVKRKWAEPPAFYSPELAARTAKNLENLVRQRGYFDATCTSSAYVHNARKRAKGDSLLRYAQVTYTVNLQGSYTIDSVLYTSRDSTAAAILQFTRSGSRLKPGYPLDGRNFDAEKLRITNEMKNRGYAYFTPVFVEFTGDSSNHKTQVTVEVLPPGTDTAKHKIYTIGNVTVLMGLAPDLAALKSDTTIGGVYFASAWPKFDVHARHLFRAIAIRPGWPYRQTDFDKTTRTLNELGVFRFVNVRFVQSPANPTHLDVEISLAPNSRFSYSMTLEANSSNSSSALAGRLFGVAGSIDLQNRNLFSGAEKLRTNISYNVEFDITRRRFIFSQQFKVQNELILPRFFDYMHLWRILNRIRLGDNRNLVSDAFYSDLRSNAKSRFSLNYSYLELFDFYLYNLVNASMGTDLRRNRHQFSFDYVGIDVLRPRTYSRFDSIFGQNKFLTNSFGDQLFTGFLLRSVNYSFSRPVNRFGEVLTFRSGFEVSGFEQYIANALWSIPAQKELWQINGLDFSKFIRIDIDGIYSRAFNSSGTTGAIRIGTGLARPYGDTKATPYVKQFFVGGPSSIRAWRIRELGPGGHHTTDSIRPFYQSGDFRFEFNAELRFPIIWFLKGAVFLDGGNIWSLDRNDDRVNSQLRWDSYKNIALGTGLGLRLDLSYFVLRLDWGLKLRRPRRNEGDNSYWVPGLIKKMQLRDWATNLAVGYPF